MLVALGLWLFIRHAPLSHRPDIMEAITFLRNCKSLREVFPDQYAKLNRLNVWMFLPNISHPKLCGQRIGNVVIIFPTADENGCYGGDIDAVLAHEILHVIGLPKHAPIVPTEQGYLEYLKTDVIELTMAACAFEADRDIEMRKGN